MSGTLEYARWTDIKARCLNPADAGFERYGARGVTICDRWRDSFEAFREDMGPPPSPAHSIERIDNNGPYSPENCRWATRREQASNRRSTQTFTWKGETLTIQEWARRTGISAPTLYWRLHHGWDAERALTTPVVPTLTLNGETLTLKQWADRSGIKKATLWARLHVYGWSLERALSR